mmetsp:Transcript_12614/g.34279  ORF Transcript_12614/g.34279 Transcript_12614/m.34279 type:complete len:323 (+) Transcript_12614:654-1622(+)
MGHLDRTRLERLANIRRVRVYRGRPKRADHVAGRQRVGVTEDQGVNAGLPLPGDRGLAVDLVHIHDDHARVAYGWQRAVVAVVEECKLSVADVLSVVLVRESTMSIPHYVAVSVEVGDVEVTVEAAELPQLRAAREVELGNAAHIADGDEHRELTVLVVRNLCVVEVDLPIDVVDVRRRVLPLDGAIGVVQEKLVEVVVDHQVPVHAHLLRRDVLDIVRAARRVVGRVPDGQRLNVSRAAALERVPREVPRVEFITCGERVLCQQDSGRVLHLQSLEAREVLRLREPLRLRGRIVHLRRGNLRLHDGAVEGHDHRVARVDVT